MIDRQLSARAARQVARYRTVWISDLHLGTRGCKTSLLLDFLRAIEPGTLYLVGDIVDGQQMMRSWYWNAGQNDVVQRILELARSGTRVVYLPGNHDALVRGYAGLSFGEIEIERDAVHTTADGRRLWVLHGDLFDPLSGGPPWLLALGDDAYNAALFLNRHLNRLRRRLGYPYWSLSRALKHRFKDAVAHMNRFETVLADEARSRSFDGVVCGHIHKAEIRDIGGVLYCNDGDWVESCTALVEQDDGRLEVVDWVATRGLSLFAELS
jgi:UDP-2,3-diacylglucosamine pyrophosphatase LpxH